MKNLGYTEFNNMITKVLVTSLRYIILHQQKKLTGFVIILAYLYFY